jgi:hypothetical protein
MTRYWFSTVAGCLISMAARADSMPMPADTPASFKTECSSCHLAFPPRLLPADDWRRVMAALDRHYGDNASVDDKARKEIEDFLVRNSGSSLWDRPGSGAGNPPRLTATLWFERKHRKVSAQTWRDPRVKSAANCTACHTGAEQGRFGEHEINMPGGRRHEHH